MNEKTIFVLEIIELEQSLQKKQILVEQTRMDTTASFASSIVFN